MNGIKVKTSRAKYKIFEVLDNSDLTKSDRLKILIIRSKFVPLNLKFKKYLNSAH